MSPSDLMSDEAMQSLLADLGNPAGDDIAAIDRAIGDHRDDPRLHFLRASVLASHKRYSEARQAMARAVEIAPSLDIARFQLGFLEYTSGEPAAAAETWKAFSSRSKDDPLTAFAAGLNALASDNIDEARTLIEHGIAHNRDNPPLNRDMRMLIDALAKDDGDAASDSDEPISAVEQLLRQAAMKPTKH